MALRRVAPAQAGCGEAWATLADVTKAAQAFLDPALAGRLDATWEPARWRWLLH